MTARRLHVNDLEQVLSATSLLWNEMRGQRIFITGGTGFFGCWLLETFCHINRQLSLNAHATVLTRNPARFAEKAPHLISSGCINILAGDVRDFRFPHGEYKFVIHAATEASALQAAEAPFEMLATILEGTQRTLEFAATHGTSRFLLTSSGAVYGKQPSWISHLPESYGGSPDPLDAASVYAEGKRTAELLCALFCKQADLECVIPRCWAFCGPHLPLNAHFAIGNFIGDVLAGRPIHVAGDGTPMRSYLFAADLAIWLWTMLFQAPSLVPVNVGSSREISILELARTVAAVLDSPAEILVTAQPKPDAPDSRYVPSVARARELLGLEQTVSLEEMIWRTAMWHRDIRTD